MDELFDVLPAPNPLGRRSPTSESYYSYRDDFLSIAGDQNDPTIILHELTHFLTHVATPYGAFLDDLNRVQGTLVREFLQKVEGPIWSPVLGWARLFKSPHASGVPFPGDFDRLIATYIQPWEACWQLEMLLEGADLRLARQGRQEPATALLHAVEQRIASGDRVPTDARENALACPTISWESETSADVHQLPCGATQLFEALATLREGLDVGIWERQRLEYMSAFALAVMRYGTAEALQLPPNDRRIATTCFALADLALFTPVGRYAHLRTSHLTWTDIHPGYRFIKALAVSAENDWWIGDFREMEAFAARVALAVGWPAPGAFLDIGADLAEPEYQRHREACELRRRSYASLYELAGGDPQEACGVFLERHMPIVSGFREATILPWPPGGDHRTTMHRLRDFFFNRALFCVMAYPEGLTQPLPDGIPYKELYFDNIEDNDDFIGILVSRYPWAALDRVQRLP